MALMAVGSWQEHQDDKNNQIGSEKFPSWKAADVLQMINSL